MIRQLLVMSRDVDRYALVRHPRRHTALVCGDRRVGYRVSNDEKVSHETGYEIASSGQQVTCNIIRTNCNDDAFYICTIPANFKVDQNAVEKTAETARKLQRPGWGVPVGPGVVGGMNFPKTRCDLPANTQLFLKKRCRFGSVGGFCAQPPAGAPV